MSGFSVRTINHDGGMMLNICDADLLGRTIRGDDHSMNIGTYYQERFVDEAEASELLLRSQIINMVGNDTVTLSLKLRVGTETAVKKIGGVPFLLVFKI